MSFPLARNTDPETSHVAANRLSKLARKKKAMQVLMEFAKKAQTAEAAAIAAGVVGGWKRASDLKEWGWVTPRMDRKGNVVRVPNISGSPADVLKITPQGRAALRAFKGIR